MAQNDTDYDVVIVGGGPTGMLLARELRLHDVRVLVLERDEEPTTLVRSLGLHARSVEILDQRGLLDRFLAAGTVHPGLGSLAGIAAPPPRDPATAHGYILGIPQPLTDRLLTEAATETGAEIRRGAEAVEIVQDDDTVTITPADGSAVRCSWAVGCDGGRSLVRRTLGVGFPGDAATREWLLGEVEVTMPSDEVAAVSNEIRRSQLGFGIGPAPEGHFRAVVPAASVSEDRTTGPSFDDFRARLREVAGTDFGAHSPRALTRFTDATRLAERYRVGRVLLAGDAAHVHPPLGGQGLNLGIQDAFNLGWKLAAVVRHRAAPDLLDTYHDERHPVAADVLSLTRAQSALISADPGTQAVRRLLGRLLEFDDVNSYLTARIASIDIRYDLGSEADLVGRRLADLPLSRGRLYELMREGRWLLLDRDGTRSIRNRDGQVDHVVDDAADLTPAAVLLRPDGHVAWSSDEPRPLDDALSRWELC
ncbi:MULTISPECIES: FAD-dependent monooxygenase [Pseudonocardia]|uniref:Pentachlorophenol 4-monooxygenase n=2 Tax=Pseudonocardia TaxID=1847 RepID=A0A1Y2N3U7_PSEAH|nr:MULTISPECIES: FAD-dependent monooxygenase [Pseudonocardia]OSY42130.1 Pentachlorophenol 4-monooxygenase [Pseudonocardia autotrophica]TDN75102.1 2-polyprenyl-6-methoxyphenol hydroxylase-like FAD-dependent oxidoreductase [Pseudonocardia autotrophica]BBF99047.1 FAD-dependent oxidoreductase [Pseudonocardia autotrophica]GEC23967.1 FAD-dependent oxidoreductase [Pseudonocardia saturnea]